MYYKVISFTPTLDTNAYATGDRMGSITEVTDFWRNVGGVNILKSIAILDTAKQKVAFDIFFFNSQPTVASADNAAIDISDAEMAKCIGHVSIATTDYCTDLAANSFATKSDINLVLKGAAPTTGAVKHLYAVLVSRGAPTYTASALTIQLGVEQA